MKALCVICCGQIQTTDVGGGFPQEEQVIRLGKILHNSSTIRMASLSYQGPINL